MIKTVLFDLGNVILPFDLLRLASRLAQFSPFSAEEISNRIGYLEIAHEFESGRMSAHEYFDYLTKSCQLSNLSYEKFVPIFNDIFDEDHNVIQLIMNLKPRYQLGLISNTNPIHVEHIKTTYSHLRQFHKLWFSNEEGIRKPDPAIYKLALEHFDVDPHESVFIDDMKPNIDSARDLGMHGIHFKDAHQLKQELTKIGVKH